MPYMYIHRWVSDQKVVFGFNSTSHKQPLEECEAYVAIGDQFIDRASLKMGFSDVKHQMCIQQMIETMSESSDSSEIKVGPTWTPQKIIHSELQVKCYSRPQIPFPHNPFQRY